MFYYPSLAVYDSFMSINHQLTAALIQPGSFAPMDLPCMNISSRLLLGASQCTKGRLRKYRKAIIDLCFWLIGECSLRPSALLFW